MISDLRRPLASQEHSRDASASLAKGCGPALVSTEPFPALNKGLSSMTLIEATTASTAEPPLVKTCCPAWVASPSSHEIAPAGSGPLCLV
jgi:hypothetical protein